YEAMSNGNFSIEFVEQEIDAPLNNVNIKYGRPWPDWHAFEASSPVFIENIDRFDTFIWCTTAIHGSAHGGGGRFPMGHGLLSPSRGFIELNPRHSVNIWVHEFFHVVESMAGISPAHGHHKKNKDKFPDWKGEVNNSLNYYNWHFNTTIPQKGWDQLKFDKKFSPIDLAGFRVLGTWKAEDITEDWKVHEYTLDGDLVESDKVEVALLYTHGWKAIDIAWVAIYHGEEQLAIDEHFGFSGTKKLDILYTLSLEKNYKKNLKLKVKMKGDGGTDSNGLVMIK
ncbi:MAG: hypothetical protein R3345_12025, partial [Fulvivirga sp.]|nr:hypothetical protein [Fulvivirga sp.]